MNIIEVKKVSKLDEIKAHQLKYKFSETKDILWLIEQAEKVERLEKEINLINQMPFIKVNNELREKVERYEKALEDIYSIAKFSRPDLVPNEVRELAWKALWMV
jgi:CRISPR/Cas system-associated exonuclease Cas4 (RecB family)